MISPPGLSGNTHSGSYLGLASSDSTDSERAVRAWGFDEQLTASGTTRLLGYFTWGMRTERDTRVFATLAPAGDHLYLTVSRFSMTQTTENAQWKECYPANRCLNYYLQVRKNEGSDVYAFTNQNGKWERRLLLSDPVAHLEVNGTSEDGRQLIVRKRTYTHTDYWLNGAGPGDVVDSCTSRYYDSTTGVLLKEVPSCFATTAP
ncbi:MAG: hypothetical protein AB1941_03535 [Gemmatimonadota bacterium]